MRFNCQTFDESFPPDMKTFSSQTQLYCSVGLAVYFIFLDFPKISVFSHPHCFLFCLLQAAMIQPWQTLIVVWLQSCCPGLKIVCDCFGQQLKKKNLLLLTQTNSDCSYSLLSPLCLLNTLDPRVFLFSALSVTLLFCLMCQFNIRPHETKYSFFKATQRPHPSVFFNSREFTHWSCCSISTFS